MVNKFFNKIVFVLTISVLLIGIVIAYTQSIPNPGHGGDIILVSVDGYSMTLQEAIDNGVLVDGVSATRSYTTQISDIGHSAEYVFVSVDGNEKTLQQAISTSLCGSGSYSYSSSIILGHSASEVLVSVNGVEMTLQNAIDSGEFCVVCVSHSSASCYNNDLYWYDSCGVREEKKTECGTSGCSGGACITCVAGDFYDWTGTCASFCASKGGSAVGTGVIFDEEGPSCENRFSRFLSGADDRQECESWCVESCDSLGLYETTTMCRCSCP